MPSDPNTYQVNVCLIWSRHEFTNHLVYKYKDQKTQMKRKLVTTIPYRKQKRLTKSVKYNNRKAFEKGTHVFEAEVDGLVLASKTVDVE